MPRVIQIWNGLHWVDAPNPLPLGVYPIRVVERPAATALAVVGGAA